MYKIKDYSYKQAEKLGVKIKPSNKKNKKIDVINKDGSVVSIGNINYLDYPSYLEINKKLADKHRKLYKTRHNYRKIKGTAGYYANKILW